MNHSSNNDLTISTNFDFQGYTMKTVQFPSSSKKKPESIKVVDKYQQKQLKISGIICLMINTADQHDQCKNKFH